MQKLRGSFEDAPLLALKMEEGNTEQRNAVGLWQLAKAKKQILSQSFQEEWSHANSPTLAHKTISELWNNKFLLFLGHYICDNLFTAAVGNQHKPQTQYSEDNSIKNGLVQKAAQTVSPGFLLLDFKVIKPETLG